jgi:hypothetical protein
VPLFENNSTRGIPAPDTFASPSNTTGLRDIRRRHGFTYTDIVGRKICERIMARETLKKISSDPHMPSEKTIIRWLVHPKLTTFREMYYYARRVQAEMLIDEIIEIADDGSNDWKEVFDLKGRSRGFKPDNEAIQRSRVRIDTRKWLAAKLVPRLYGEKVDHHHELTGDLTELLKAASNQTTGLPSPIEGKVIANTK